MKMRISGVAAAVLLASGVCAQAGQFTVHSLNDGPNGTVGDLSQAQALLQSNPSPQGAGWFNSTGSASVINYKIFDGYSYADWFANDSTFPNLPTGTTTFDQAGTENFVVEATGNLIIPTAGNYTFDVNSDDGFYLKIGSFNRIAVLNDRLNGDTLVTYDFTSPGTYSVDLQYYQNTGHAEVEFSAASGTYTTSDSTTMKNFHLVGAADGLQLAGTSTPEPSALALVGVGCLGLLKRRRRMA